MSVIIFGGYVYIFCWVFLYSWACVGWVWDSFGFYGDFSKIDLFVGVEYYWVVYVVVNLVLLIESFFLVMLCKDDCD